MSARLRTLLRLLCCLVLGAIPSPFALAAAPARSVSTSRQFIVYGPDAQLRGAVCDLAERTKSTALSLLREQDNWKTPIVIDAQPPQANSPELPPAHLEVSQTGFGLKLQLGLQIGADVDAPLVEREMLRAIFLEMMYRALPEVPAGTPLVQPPDWLLEGALALGRDPLALTDALGTAIAGGNVMALDEFLRQRASLLEAPSRKLYRAYAAALVSMLTEMPDGKPHLVRFLADLPRAGNDPLAELRAHFPALGQDAETTQKNWSRQVSHFASSQRYLLLGCEESERQLAKLLHLEIPGADNAPVVYALDEFPRFVRDPRAAPALQAVRQQLLLFSGGVHPLYRPIVAEYQQILDRLARRKTSRIAQRLASLRETREHLSRRMGEIGDYLNWFEATQARSVSGAFREFLKAAELAEEPRPRRRDPISVYLDSLESQLDN